MRCIICGSRSFSAGIDIIKRAVAASGFEKDITEVVSGDAKGIDYLGACWAKSRGIPVKHFPISKEDWAEQGKRAGPRRNLKMIEYANATGDGLCIAIFDGKSKGTRHCFTAAKKAGLKVFVGCPKEVYGRKND